MPSMSYEESFTSIDTGAMREAASGARDKLKAINAQAAELLANLKVMSTVWSGAAEKEYEETVSKAVTDVVASATVYGEITDDLEQIIEDYERAHGIATNVAQSIEKATWADPLA